jgi:hypothetical protein
MFSTAQTPESTIISKQGLIDPKTLADAIPLLKHRLKACIAERNFMEAEILKHRIDELEIKHHEVQQSILKSRQSVDRVSVEEAHLDDYREFNAHWDQVMKKYESDSEAQLKELKVTHEAERRSKLEELEKLTPTVYKPSSKLLEMRQKVGAFVKNQMFIEAHNITHEIELREHEEQKAHDTHRQVIIKKKLKFFEERKQVELTALKDKLKVGFEELERQRGSELETVIKRYQANATQLVISQSIEKNKYDGLHTTLAGRSSLDVTSISRIIASSRASTPGVSYRPKRRVDS